MNKGLILSIFLLFGLTVGNVHFLDAVPGDYLEMYVTYRNTGSSEAENSQVTVYIPDMHVYARSNTFDVRGGDNGVRIMLPYIPEETQPGWYPMWTMVSNDWDRNWQFDWLYVTGQN